MKQNRSKTKTVVRVIAFLLIVALVYGALTRLLTINNATEQQYIRSFYLEPKNSLDVMILGASETFTDYCAPLAWQHAGFTSYPLAVSAAQGTMYPSMLREAAKRQSPTVYVVEVNGFLYTEDERKELGKAATREWLDTLPLSRNKVQAINECVQGKRLSYYVPLLKYHDNWRKRDLIRNSLSLQQQARDAGYSYTKPFLSISMFLTETDEIPVRQQSLDDFNEQSLRTFCETARAQGIKNVLFARFPHRTVIENYDAVFAELEAVVHEYGYDFVNFDTQMDAIGLDPLNDFANAEHLNIFGAEKFTPYLADYLAQHYDLNTAHSQAVTDEWTRCAAFTQQMLPVCEDNTRRYTSERLDEFSAVFADCRWIKQNAAPFETLEGGCVFCCFTGRCCRSRPRRGQFRRACRRPKIPPRETAGSRAGRCGRRGRRCAARPCRCAARRCTRRGSPRRSRRRSLPGAAPAWTRGRCARTRRRNIPPGWRGRAPCRSWPSRAARS